MRTRATLVLLALAACGGGDSSEPFDSANCTNLDFREVNPANSDAAFRAEVEAALTLLCESNYDGDLGFQTYKSIVSGRVEIDVLEDLSELDFRTVLVFYELAPDTTREEALPIILPDLAGYMWGNRIYVVTGAPVASLAATLVHEVNHVLNRSDENYYLPLDRDPPEPERTEILNALRVDPGRAFVEEYRAFYLERVVDGATLDHGMSEDLSAFKREIATLYGFSELDVATFPDLPVGLLVPDDETWERRPASLCAPNLLYFSCE